MAEGKAGPMKPDQHHPDAPLYQLIKSLHGSATLADHVKRSRVRRTKRDSQAEANAVVMADDIECGVATEQMLVETALTEGID